MLFCRYVRFDHADREGAEREVSPGERVDATRYEHINIPTDEQTDKETKRQTDWSDRRSVVVVE
jgi:hypothetical protein